MKSKLPAHSFKQLSASEYAEAILEANDILSEAPFERVYKPRIKFWSDGKVREVSYTGVEREFYVAHCSAILMRQLESLVPAPPPEEDDDTFNGVVDRYS